MLMLLQLSLELVVIPDTDGQQVYRCLPVGVSFWEGHARSLQGMLLAYQGQV